MIKLSKQTKVSDVQNRNILNSFKQILGEYCAINQFVELSKRSFLADHSVLLTDTDKFAQFANNNSITLTYCDPLKMVHSISLSYIVNVHLCFETFLKQLYQQIKDYGQNQFQEKKQEESWLKSVSKNINGERFSPDIKPMYALCEYYRLVRNSAVHDLCNVETHSSEYKRLSDYDFKKDTKYSKLTAPNSYEKISFDDFILFARSCVELATYLYENCEFDYIKIVADIPNQQLAKWKKYKPERRKHSICLYMKTYFKVDTNFKSQLPNIIRLILARSSNG
ncbi:MAG: hypothetical protein LKK00_00945 [Intestinimonas sp.]|nr:hypothetical protein [Intestinimonas sp.]